MRRIVLSVAGAAALAACGAAGSGNSSAPATTSAATTSTTTISTASTSLGTVLTNAKGFTLYYFLPEKNSTIGACTGGCLSVWPPLVASDAALLANSLTW